MYSKFLSTLTARTSCPHVNWPDFVLDGGKSHFNCPLICCKMLLHQQLHWHRIKYTGKHYFPHKLSTVPKATKSYFQLFFLLYHPFFSFSFFYRTACNEFHLSGIFSRFPPVHINMQSRYSYYF